MQMHKYFAHYVSPTFWGEILLHNFFEIPPVAVHWDIQSMNFASKKPCAIFSAKAVHRILVKLSPPVQFPRFLFTIKCVRKFLLLFSLLIQVYCTGGPRYSRGLPFQNIPRIPKPWITRDHCFRILLSIFAIK